MRDIEKNDVDVLKLFNWNKQVDLSSPDAKNKATIYMRVVNDNDLQRARVHGLRKSALLRDKLKQADSDERAAFLLELGQFDDKEVLVETVVAFSIPSFRTEAIRNVDLPLPKEPKSEDPSEKFEEYQASVDSYPARFADEVIKYLENKAEAERAKLSDMSFEQLYAKYQSLIVDRLVSEEMTKEYYSMLTYYACYTDDKFKNKLFGSFEEFNDYPAFVKDKLVSEYQSLEMGMGDLKK